MASRLPNYMDHQTEASSLSTTLVYLKKDELYNHEKPFVLLVDVSHIPGAKHTNVIEERHPDVPIQDVRGEASKLKLDVHGFELWDFEDSMKEEEFEDESWVDNVYIPKLEKALIAKLGAKEAHVIHFGLRLRPVGYPEQPTTNGDARYNLPVQVVHTDFSSQSALDFFEERWPSYSPDMLTSRLQIINVWRPLVEEIREWPLALCDQRSVGADDLRTGDVVRAKGPYEAVYATFNPLHSWFYLSNQKSSESWLFKLYDSDSELENLTWNTSGVLHCSLNIGENVVPRRSCEARVLVRY
ncbi:hypothetical protein GGR58DRAFT_42788 [Xylaria digitata]|nr:hypothetical protein GGR58DRAFT_42788 [Xylaria digitata]